MYTAHKRTGQAVRARLLTHRPPPRQALRTGHWLLGVLRLQVEQLGDDEVGLVVIDWAVTHDDTLP